MAKNSITDYSGTSSNNSDVQSVDISEGCSPSGINNAIREVMADLADVNDGTVALTSPSAVTLSTDTISEKTSGSGVTIDSVLLKDGALGSIASAVAAHLTSINGGQIGGNRNLIINGAMQVAQRGTSTASISSGNNFVLDRFRLQLTNGGTWTMSQSTTVPSGQGFSKSLKLDCTTADTSFGGDDLLQLQHLIEGQNLQHLAYGTSDAKTVTVSFWIRSNKTGTYTVEVMHQTSSNTYPFTSKTFTISSANTWEKKTLSFAGDTSADIINSNAVGYYLNIWLGAGSLRTSGTFSNGTWNSTKANRVSSSNVNLADSTSNELYLTGVQLEAGDTATEFQHESYGETLSKCQRYFISWPNTATNDRYYGTRYSTGNGFVFLHCPVTMRAIPTVGYTGTQTSTGLDTTSYNSTHVLQIYMTSTVPYVENPTADAEL